MVLVHPTAGIAIGAIGPDGVTTRRPGDQVGVGVILPAWFALPTTQARWQSQ